MAGRFVLKLVFSYLTKSKSYVKGDTKRILRLKQLACHFTKIKLCSVSVAFLLTLASYTSYIFPLRVNDMTAGMR